MKLLLDTHILLWWLADDPLLSEKARNSIRNSNNIIYVSAASAWEIAIKKALGKLTIPNDLEQIILANGFQMLNIGMAHAEKAGALPPHHRDPFDRMLIAQAQLESMTLLSRDKILKKYKLSLLLV